METLQVGDASAQLVDAVRQALHEQQPLRIRGGDTKAFLGRSVAGRELDTRAHCGIVQYDPSELVVTVRSGTPVAHLMAVLDEAGQTLPCEPPTFGDAATVGGMVASGLAGPRRPWSGSVRDFVLGCRMITGQGKHLRFGGEVMKNVAGYDVARLMAGSFGCLGVLTEVSLKVLPKPRAAQSISMAIDAAQALSMLTEWRRAGLPLSAASHVESRLHVRFEGGTGSVHAALQQVGGEPLDSQFWGDLREHRLPFFADSRPLWRLSLPDNTPLLALPGDTLLDWGGAQRWLKSDADAARIREIAHAAGGHATCFTPTPGVEPFSPLPEALTRLHRQLKSRMDPGGIFNPSRMYAGL